MDEKILVCITAQINSKRLIQKGAVLCDSCNGELHILHVIKGDNVFEDEKTPMKLQELFEYGSALGGQVHMYCDDDIPASIGAFIQKEAITRVVLGTPPAHIQQKIEQEGNQLKKILETLPVPVEVVILKREGAA